MTVIEKFRYLLVLVVLLICSSCVFTIRANKIVVVDTKKYHTIVVKLISNFGFENTASIATGFAVNEDYIITAGHFCDSVLKDTKEKKVNPTIIMKGTDDHGFLYEVGKTTIVTISKSHDLCLLLSKEHGLKFLPIVDNLDLVETEDTISVIGAPMGYFPVRREGTVISLMSSSFKIENLLFLNIDIQEGSSGSPVIWNGYIIGVVVILPQKLHNSALATRGDYLKNFVDPYLNTGD